ncbi:MAG TPA: hypothetical protein VGT99_13360 [Gammaproteobacteria bacterium]|nr:hypothetical protein [Gammaproteobacteria bacterium]
MKIPHKQSIVLAFAALLAAIACGAAQAAAPSLPQYLVVSLGNPNGGTVSQGTGITDNGLISGYSALPNGALNAEVWVYGFPVNLGTLGGAGNPTLNSAVAWPNHNNHGVVVGISETTDVNPLNEKWSCALAVFGDAVGVGQHDCVGFVWKGGVMTPLPTLGGYDGFATSVNDEGEIVGWAETTLHDPSCNANGQVLQFEAVMWVKDGGHYVARALPGAKGDPDGSATAINQWGQVVGISGGCGGAIGGATGKDMVMWEDGHVARTLPTFGGSFWNTPMDINARGDVVGFSDYPGDGPTFAGVTFHAFFWSQRPFVCHPGEAPMTGTCDLEPTGSPTNAPLSEALGVNVEDQVVGASFVTGHAFIWQAGVQTDLNKCIASNSASLVLTDAQEINDAGVITGQAQDPSGTLVAFVAIPVGGVCQP